MMENIAQEQQGKRRADAKHVFPRGTPSSRRSIRAAAGVIGALLLWTGSLSCGMAADQGATPVPQTDIGRKSGTLSDKLDATSGVIHPEGSVDPKMQKPAPATGTMPVIPPPGSPGGEPGLVPK